MLAVVSAYLKHNQKKYYFTDSVLCNISSKKEGYKYTEELEYTLIDNCFLPDYMPTRLPSAKQSKIKP